MTRTTLFLVAALTVLFGHTAYGQQVSVVNCEEELARHPGSLPAHPAGHARENETITEEFRRTGNSETHHRKLTYAHIDQLAYCLGEMIRRLGRMQEDIEFIRDLVQNEPRP